MMKARRKVLGTIEEGMQDAQRSRGQEADAITALAEHLAPGEAMLVKAIYERGLRAAELAHATGLPAYQVQRRLKRLMRRLSSPIFQHVVARARTWPERRRKVAESIVLQGRTQRETAEALGLSLHEVRREVERVRGMYEEAEVARRAASSASDPRVRTTKQLLSKIRESAAAVIEGPA